LAHHLKIGEPGSPVSFSHDGRKASNRLAVTGEHNVFSLFGAAQKLGEMCFGVAY
jgi:hypothetical protein